MFPVLFALMRSSCAAAWDCGGNEEWMKSRMRLKIANQRIEMQRLRSGDNGNKGSE